ncbi:MAG: class I mannose-6-phosphate isomerase [Oscillospiraceae bacterium]|nr:class I mannose-6-phosphate isomerase [Oscillospiraceae bacterium]
MYPLLLTPHITDYIWGGTRLKTEFGYPSNAAVAAEAWVLSCHADGPSVVVNGPLAGQTLPQVLAVWGKDALGTRAAAFDNFPILIKLIDAADRLSIQVHPADDYALRVEGEYGKTEMWYVVDCEPGAQLIYGFTRELSREEYRDRVAGNTLTEVCNFVPVQKGDVFFIQAGTLHAIGAGILIAEVQQNSNTTYRVSDYGRLGADGKPRPLHIDKAVDVTTLAPPAREYGQIGERRTIAGGVVRPLASCELFTAELWQLEGTMSAGLEDSFVSLLCLDGEGLVNDGKTTLNIKKGASLFLPAGMTAALEGKGEFICSYI